MISLQNKKFTIRNLICQFLRSSVISKSNLHSFLFVFTPRVCRQIESAQVYLLLLLFRAVDRLRGRKSFLYPWMWFSCILALELESPRAICVEYSQIFSHFMLFNENCIYFDWYRCKCWGNCNFFERFILISSHLQNGEISLAQSFCAGLRRYIN